MTTPAPSVREAQEALDHANRNARMLSHALRAETDPDRAADLEDAYADALHAVAVAGTRVRDARQAALTPAEQIEDVRIAAEIAADVRRASAGKLRWHRSVTC